jgi:hypothetical protein
MAWAAGGLAGIATLTLWGNRIFIRSNDYLHCFRDPQTPLVPSKAFETLEKPCAIRSLRLRIARGC